MYFNVETEYVSWKTLLDWLEDYGHPCNLQESNLISGLVEPIYNQIGWAGQPDFDTHFPELFVEITTKTACRYKAGNCTTYALNDGLAWYQCMQKNGDDFMQCSTIILPVHRSAVYCVLAQNDTIYFNYLQNRYCGISHPTVDQKDLVFGLQCAGTSRCPSGSATKHPIENRRDNEKKKLLKLINNSKI